LTFLSSAYLVFGSPSTLPRVVVVAGNVAALLAAREHVGDFWRRKAKVPLPGIGDYNEAISKTQEVRLSMAYMAASWVAISGLSLLL